MTRKELSQVYYLRKEIAMWERELREFQQSSEVSLSPSDGTGARAKNKISTPVENKAIRTAGIEERIENLKREAEEAQRRILDFIMTLDDSMLRQIINYRCIRCMGWVKVARLIGGGNTAGSVSTYFYRAIPKDVEFVEQNCDSL